MRPTAIDLFCGAGGLSLGFERAGFDIVGAVDLDPLHCAAHEYNFPTCTTVCADIADLTGNILRNQCGLALGVEIDAVVGGAPCQGFSLIGKRCLDDPRNALAMHFVRMVKELQPKYFVFENVKGLAVGQHKGFLGELLEAFQAAGYQTATPYKILNSLHFGVPQKRERLFLIGWRNDQSPIEYPEQAFSLNTNAPKPPTVSDAIQDLPDVERHPELFQNDFTTSADFGEKSLYVRRVNGDGKSEFSYPRIYDETILTSSRRTKHTALSEKRFAATPQGTTEAVSRFFRLSLEGYCNTLRAGTASDRGAHTSPRPIHPTKPRCITNREALRLHSYPDWFRVHTTKWHGFRQIGNSVPPLLAQAVASQLISGLGIMPQKPSQGIPLGDAQLLSLNMSEAAAYYGVPRTVIPQRIRKKVSNG